ncbi:MAG: Mur ligase family protein, partial [Rubrivivax sp.]
MNELADRNVLVLGLGASGLAMAAWCARQGARVQVWDSREAPPQAAALAERVPGARRLPCATGPEALAGVHWVLKSPGLAPHDAQVAPLLEAARAAGIRTGGELDLFVQALAELRATRGYAPRLLAVTGTNGKTTTTALAALLIERAGRTARAAGNIGPTMLDSLAQALQADALPQVWVLELSSFQLHDLHPTAPYQPDAAVVLNLSQDHLDWHGTMDDYAAAKARVFGAHGTVVINADDARVAAMAPAVPEASALRRGARRAAAAVPRPVVRFGLQVPRHGGDFGLVSEAGMSWLVRALPREEGVRPAAAEEEPPIIQRLMPADAMRLRGRHNAANALAALALACAIGCPLAPMLHGLREYRGEPHRVQWVAEVEGVEAFDDSKGTNVGATVAALEGLGAE